MVVIEDIIIAASEKLKLTQDHELYLGTEAMVSKKLLDVSPENRYPLIAVVTGFNEYSDNSGFISFTFQRIVFGTLATTTDPPIKRLATTFKPILYPLYEGFMDAFSKQTGIVYREWRVIPYIKNNIYGESPATDKIADVLDAIEIKNFTNKIQPQTICG